MNYQRYLQPNFEPFDPLKLAKQTDELVTRGRERKYTDIYSVPVYRGIATGYAVGCCLRCVYCWSGFSRDFPEKHGEFYNPDEVFEELSRAARQGVQYGSKSWRNLSVDKFRVSGCEPTIGRDHLINLLEKFQQSHFPLFVLETNGILLGDDPSYAEELAKFDNLYVRVSIKAATPEGFEKRTGGIGERYELPFKALEHLLKEGIDCRAAAMTDPRIMPREERKELIKKLKDIQDWLGRRLEEERIDPYKPTQVRLEKAGIDLDLQ